MRIILAMAAIPLVVYFGVPSSQRPVAIAAKAVQTEGVTARRMDDDTFRSRWRPVTDMPPAIEVRRYPVPELAASSAGAVVSSKEPPAPPPSRRLHTRPAQLDICAKHRMRKVYYGRTWRCRR